MKLHSFLVFQINKIYLCYSVSDNHISLNFGDPENYFVVGTPKLSQIELSVIPKWNEIWFLGPQEE